MPNHQKRFFCKIKLPKNYSHVAMFFEGGDGPWYGYYCDEHFYHVGENFDGSPALGVRATELVASWKYSDPGGCADTGDSTKKDLNLSASEVVKMLLSDYEESLEINHSVSDAYLRRFAPCNQLLQAHLYRPGQLSIIHTNEWHHDKLTYKAWRNFLSDSQIDKSRKSVYLCTTYRAAKAFFRYPLKLKTDYFKLVEAKSYYVPTKSELINLRNFTNRLNKLPVRLFKFLGFKQKLLKTLTSELAKIAKNPNLKTPGLILIEILAPQSDAHSLLSRVQTEDLTQLATQHNLAIVVIATTVSYEIEGLFNHYFTF